MELFCDFDGVYNIGAKSLSQIKFRTLHAYNGIFGAPPPPPPLIEKLLFSRPHLLNFPSGEGADKRREKAEVSELVRESSEGFCNFFSGQPERLCTFAFCAFHTPTRQQHPTYLKHPHHNTPFANPELCHLAVLLVLDGTI